MLPSFFSLSLHYITLLDLSFSSQSHPCFLSSTYFGSFINKPYLSSSHCFLHSACHLSSCSFLSSTLLVHLLVSLSPPAPCLFPLFSLSPFPLLFPILYSCTWICPCFLLVCLFRSSSPHLLSSPLFVLYVFSVPPFPLLIYLYTFFISSPPLLVSFLLFSLKTKPSVSSQYLLSSPLLSGED